MTMTEGSTIELLQERPEFSHCELMNEKVLAEKMGRTLGSVRAGLMALCDKGVLLKEDGGYRRHTQKAVHRRRFARPVYDPRLDPLTEEFAGKRYG